MASNDGAYLGLGYSYGASTATSSSHHEYDDGRVEGVVPSSSSVASDLLANLMQQCLAYHEAQQQQQTTQQQPWQSPTTPVVQSQQQQQPRPVPDHSSAWTQSGFVKGETYERLVDAVPPTTTVSSTTCSGGSRAPLNQAPPTATAAAATPEEKSKKNDEIAAQEGRARANAILEKFQKLQQAHGAAESSSTCSPSITPIISATTTTVVSDYRQKRQRCLEQEAQRKKQFLVKNLEYVTQRSQKQLQQQLAQVTQAKQWETQVQEQYRLALEARKQRLRGANKASQNTELQTQAGIGTNKRKRVEHIKQQTTHQHLQQKDATVSVYLTGIPSDGSVPETTIHGLFSSYGKIRKVHFYRDKRTNNLKGDGLVVFHCPQEKQHSKNSNNNHSSSKGLLEMVCSQMNGAELPCGSILQVQPADSSYNNNGSGQEQQQQSHYGPQGMNQDILTGKKQEEQEAEKGAGDKENKDDKNDDDEDLDDFFDSLE